MYKRVNKQNAVKTNFEKGYYMLPVKFQAGVRNTIMMRCGWKTLMTFYRKCKGEVEIKPPEIREIEEIFQKHNIDPWTGENIAS